MCMLPEDRHYSFSALSLFDECPMAFKLQYIDRMPKDQNGFAAFGSFCHKLLEGWAKDEIPAVALAEEYEAGYDAAVTAPFPPFPKGLPQKYYEAGLDYFKNFDGFGDYEILDVEAPFEYRVDGYRFIGFVDLVLRDRDGDIYIIDHKSKSSKQMTKDLPTYRKQLYTYARFVYEKYGVFPKKIGFNLFREGGEMVWEDFDERRYEATMDWIASTIKRIQAETEWKVSSSSFFCRFICSVFSSCPAKDVILYGGGRGEKNE